MEVTDEQAKLIEQLLKVEGNRPDSLGICTAWNRNPEGPQAVAAIQAAQAALATARAEAEALREALTAHNLRAANGDEITVADELEQAASTLEAFVVADKEHPLLDCADDDGVEYQSEYMASLMDHATINARTLRKWAHSLRDALSKGPTQ